VILAIIINVIIKVKNVHIIYKFFLARHAHQRVTYYRASF